jgi:tol-pal system beta propeller repeat protein TolB
MTSRSSRWPSRVLSSLLLTSLLALSTSTEAAFPGSNGKIAFVGVIVTSLGELSSYTYGIHIVNADGTGQQQVIAQSSTFTYSPSWSPDGDQIAFVSGGALKVVNANGTGLTQVATASNGIYYPAWSPDGTKIAFAKYRKGTNRLEIFTVNANGSGLTQITNNGANDATDGGPAWSPDGTRIAFHRYPTTVGSSSKIFVVNANGSGLRQISNGSGDDLNPDWSPDGTKLVFQQGAGFAAMIAVMNADGSNLQPQLASGESPAWSPDGTKIVFRANFPGYQLVTMSPNGSGQTVIPNPSLVPVGTVGKSVQEEEPDWQPLP